MKQIILLTGVALNDSLLDAGVPVPYSYIAELTHARGGSLHTIGGADQQRPIGGERHSADCSHAVERRLLSNCAILHIPHGHCANAPSPGTTRKLRAVRRERDG